MSRRSVNLTTLFLGRLRPPVNQYFVHILSPEIVERKTDGQMDMTDGQTKNQMPISHLAKAGATKIAEFANIMSHLI